MITLSQSLNFNDSDYSKKYKKIQLQSQEIIFAKETDNNGNITTYDWLGSRGDGDTERFFYNGKRIYYNCDCVACTNCNDCQHCTQDCYNCHECDSCDSCNGCNECYNYHGNCFGDCYGCHVCDSCYGCDSCTSCYNECNSACNQGCQSCAHQCAGNSNFGQGVSRR